MTVETGSGENGNISSEPDPDRSVEPGVWRYAMAARAHVVIDGGPYFELMQDAMLRARQRILLIGWDFDTRIHLVKGRRWWNIRRRGTYPSRLGAFVPWLVRRRKSLQVNLLKWNVSIISILLRGTMSLDILRWRMARRIQLKFDSAHPVGCSHHQKIVVIDDCFAVCGGIDMTAGRWDTCDHIEDDPRRKTPRGRPCGPWHDATMMLEGEAAACLGVLGRRRWEHAGGRPLPMSAPQKESPWPEALEPQFRDVEIGISRTRAEHGDCREIREIEELFVRHIRRVKHFVYIESQYFASRVIGEAIAARLAEENPPEFILVMPLTAEGWLEQKAMDGARVRLIRSLGERDPKGRFRVYVPHTGDTPIYVHAKIMIVDDEIVRIGSANMNNRSQGLDSECDLFIDVARPANAHAGDAIRALRHSLLAEHCGLEPSTVCALLESCGSMARMIDNAPRDGQKTLRLFELPELGEMEQALADNAVLDPESPEEMFEPIGGRRGLFRWGSILRRPRGK